MKKIIILREDALKVYLNTFSHLVIQRMFATLAQSDHAIKKSAQVYKMNLKEQANYEHLNQEIGKF